MTLFQLRSKLVSLYICECGKAADEREARLATDAVLCSKFGFDFSSLITNLIESVDETDVSVCSDMVMRAARGEPVQYVCGEAPFLCRMFKVNRNVLIPRPDTELLYCEALKRIEKAGEKGIAPCDISVLDLCTGSGIIAISLKLAYKEAYVAAGDISADAIEIARENATKYGAEIDFIVSDLFDSFPCDIKFDVIASNPPYISDAEFDMLDPSVKEYEPGLALKGGTDGLDFYRRIASDAVLHIRNGGWLCFEIGENQGKAVLEILSGQGFRDIYVVQDIEKRDRVVCGKYCG